MQAKQFSIKFDGVEVKPGSLTGTILSGDIIDNFDKSWIQTYQRGRVPCKKKIKELVEVFKSNGNIEAVTLNLIGEHVVEKREALLEGSFHVVDGQQRILALVDSGIRDIRIKAEVYLNISYEQEVVLFQQQRKRTPLTFGDFVKSAQGSYAYEMNTLIKKRVYPFQITVNPSKVGMSFSVICPVINMAHKKLINNSILKQYPHGKDLHRFFENIYEQRPVEFVTYAVKNVFQSFADIFGEFDTRSLAYRRCCFLAYCAVVIEHFLGKDGKVDFRKFKSKFYEMPDKLLKSSVFKEYVSNSNATALFEMKREIILYLNFRMKDGHLLVPERSLYETQPEESPAIVAKENYSAMQESLL